MTDHDQQIPIPAGTSLASPDQPRAPSSTEPLPTHAPEQELVGGLRRWNSRWRAFVRPDMPWSRYERVKVAVNVCWLMPIRLLLCVLIAVLLVAVWLAVGLVAALRRQPTHAGCCGVVARWAGSLAAASALFVMGFVVHVDTRGRVRLDRGRSSGSGQGRGKGKGKGKGMHRRGGQLARPDGLSLPCACPHHGTLPPLTVIANHTSYIDVLLMMAYYQNPAFVIKGSIRSMPLIGFLAEVSGGIFVHGPSPTTHNRTHTSDASRTNNNVTSSRHTSSVSHTHRSVGRRSRRGSLSRKSKRHERTHTADGSSGQSHAPALDMPSALPINHSALPYWNGLRLYCSGLFWYPLLVGALLLEPCYWLWHRVREGVRGACGGGGQRHRPHCRCLQRFQTRYVESLRLLAECDPSVRQSNNAEHTQQMSSRHALNHNTSGPFTTSTCRSERKRTIRGRAEMRNVCVGREGKESVGGNEAQRKGVNTAGSDGSSSQRGGGPALSSACLAVWRRQLAVMKPMVTSPALTGLITDQDGGSGPALALHHSLDQYQAPLVCFPEGCTTNGACMVPFRRGAFLSQLPIQIVSIQLPFRHFSPAWETYVFTHHLLHLLCQFVNYAELTVWEPLDPHEACPFAAGGYDTRGSSSSEYVPRDCACVERDLPVNASDAHTSRTSPRTSKDSCTQGVSSVKAHDTAKGRDTRRGKPQHSPQIRIHWVSARKGDSSQVRPRRWVNTQPHRGERKRGTARTHLPCRPCVSAQASRLAQHVRGVLSGAIGVPHVNACRRDKRAYHEWCFQHVWSPNHQRDAVTRLLTAASGMQPRCRMFSAFDFWFRPHLQLTPAYVRDSMRAVQIGCCAKGEFTRGGDRNAYLPDRNEHQHVTWAAQEERYGGAGRQFEGLGGQQKHHGNGSQSEGLQKHGSQSGGLQKHHGNESQSEGLQKHHGNGSQSEGLQKHHGNGSQSEGLQKHGSQSEGLQKHGSQSEGLSSLDDNAAGGGDTKNGGARRARRERRLSFLDEK